MFMGKNTKLMKKLNKNILHLKFKKFRLKYICQQSVIYEKGAHNHAVDLDQEPPDSEDDRKQQAKAKKAKVFEKCKIK